MNRAHTVVELVPYDADWPRRFRATAAELRSAFPTAAIEHIGSTSVPGLSSKDTIDVAVGVPDVLAALDRQTLDALAASGFLYRPASFADDPDHAFLDRIVADHRTDHIHVIRLGSEVFSGHILFRDFLRANPDAAARYERAKLELAARFHDRRNEYVDRKQAIVDALMREACEWGATEVRARGR